MSHEKTAEKPAAEKPAAAPKPTFKPGDTVQLRSSQWPMTVLSINSAHIAGRGEKGEVNVCWIDDAGKLHRDHFPPSAIQLYKVLDCTSGKVEEKPAETAPKG